MKARKNTVKFWLRKSNVAVCRAARNLNLVSRRIEYFEVHPPRFLRVTDLKTTFTGQIKRECSRFQAWPQSDSFYGQQCNSADRLRSWPKGSDTLRSGIQKYFILVVSRAHHQVSKYEPQVTHV